MKVTLASGNSNAIALNENERSFKVTIVGLPTGGTWGVQVSPDGDTWFDHETLTSISGNKIGNLYFPIPYVRFTCTAGGEFFVFGSIV